MKAFVWDPSYEVGHPRIDAEHKVLVGWTNDVLALQGQPEVGDRLAEILGRLLQYARVHFSAEEALMAEYGIDERHATSHREAHRAFADEVRRIQQLPFEAEQLRRTGEFLSGWLLGHILSYDKALARELSLDGTAAHQRLPRLGREQRGLLAVLTQIIDGMPVAAFVLDDSQRVRYWNRACVRLSGVPAHEVFGTTQPWRGFYPSARPVLANLLFSDDVDRALREAYPDARRDETLIAGTVQAEVHFPQMGEGGRWLHCIAAPLYDENGQLIGAVEALLDVTERRLARQALLDSQGRLAQEVAARTQELVRRTEELARSNAQLHRAWLTSIKVFTGLMEVRGSGLAGHARRVAESARDIARHMGLTETEVQDVFLGGLLHDVGKLGLPDVVLTTAVREMTPAEWHQYRQHALLGEQALMPMDNLQVVAKFVRSHHERFDGLGHPDGLHGEQIPMGARILALANELDHLLHGRQTAVALTPAMARQQVSEARGSRFDPAVVDAWLALDPLHATPEDRIVSVSQLRPGDILARDWVSSDGLLLLAAEREFDARLIEQIRQFQAKSPRPVRLHIRPVSGDLRARRPTHQ